jgi:hypothetical protein
MVTNGPADMQGARIDLTRATALAVAIETMTSGPARVLAAELRALLESAGGGAAHVVSLAERRGR